MYHTNSEPLPQIALGACVGVGSVHPANPRLPRKSLQPLEKSAPRAGHSRQTVERLRDKHGLRTRRNPIHPRVSLDVVDFGQRLRWLREARRLAPEELAELANDAWRSWGSPDRRFTGSWIRLMERGWEGAVHTVAQYRILALAMALDIAPDRLMSPMHHTLGVGMRD